MYTDASSVTSANIAYRCRKMPEATGKERNMNATMLPFSMSRMPVTNAIYKLFVDATGYKSPRHWDGNRIPVEREQHPVVYVSLIDAQHFCQWAGVRLPTHSEWQLAASGPNGSRYPWGSQLPNEKHANFNCQIGDTTPVGSYPYGRSYYGLLDMAGNVFELTSTPYSTPEHRSTMPQRNRAHLLYVVCGGSFYDSAHQLECTRINWVNRDTVEDMMGFRVVLERPLMQLP